MDFGAPAKVEAAGLREWLRRPECGGGSIQMLTEKDVWNEANEGDMIAICRQQHEVDNFTKWVYTDFLSWFHNNWGHREKVCLVPEKARQSFQLTELFKFLS